MTEMHNRLILIMFLALMLVGSALSATTEIPASQDVYISLGTSDEKVFNQTDRLLCEVNVTDINGTKMSSYPGVPMMQFDISGLNITDDDIGILVLKAASREKKGDDAALVELLTISSEWNEESDYTTLLVNILPAWNIIKKNDLSLMSPNTDGDLIFAFDVSKKLLEAKASSDRISFLLQVASNNSYKFDFLSRETGQGPYLLVMPYPGESKSDLASMLNESSMRNETAILNETSMLNKTSMPNETAILNETSTLNKTSVFNETSTLNEASMLNETSTLNEASMLNKTSTLKKPRCSMKPRRSMRPRCSTRPRMFNETSTPIQTSLLPLKEGAIKETETDVQEPVNTSVQESQSSKERMPMPLNRSMFQEARKVIESKNPVANQF